MVHFSLAVDPVFSCRMQCATTCLSSLTKRLCWLQIILSYTLGFALLLFLYQDMRLKRKPFLGVFWSHCSSVEHSSLEAIKNESRQTVQAKSNRNSIVGKGGRAEMYHLHKASFLISILHLQNSHLMKVWDRDTSLLCFIYTPKCVGGNK